MPKLSVVMSVYNGEKYLIDALDSILNQTFEDFEFIIFEDGSTDTSLEILKKYELLHPRIILIQKEQNIGIQGFIENLNAGLQHANGQLIARMDQDDISLPTRFEEQIDYLDKNPDIFMVGSSLELIDENDQPIRLMKALASNEDIQNTMYKNISMYHPVIMFRNDETVRYRKKMFYCEDYDLYLRLMQSGKKFANITTPLLKYRILQSSISRKDNTFIRRLFVEKAKQFFLERKKTGKDQYDDFRTENFMKILEDDSPASLTVTDMKFVILVALKYQYKTILKLLSEKAQKLYPKDFYFKKAGIIAKFPTKAIYFYYKLLYRF